MRDLRIAVAAVVATVAGIGAARAVTDTSFTYSQAKTGWYSVVPAELAPVNSSVSYAATRNQLNLLSDNSNCFTAGLHLPQGAKITQLVIWYQSGIRDRPTFFVERTSPVTGNFDQIVVAAGNDNSNTRKTLFGDPPSAISSVVNNGSFNYALLVCLATTDNIFYGARIAYTYRSAGD